MSATKFHTHTNYYNYNSIKAVDRCMTKFINVHKMYKLCNGCIYNMEVPCWCISYAGRLWTVHLSSYPLTASTLQHLSLAARAVDTSFTTMAYTNTNGQQFVIIIISQVLLINVHCRYLTLMCDKASYRHFLSIHATSGLQRVAARNWNTDQRNALSRRRI